MDTDSMPEKVHIEVKTLERVGTYTPSPGSTNKSPFWTWRVCIRPASGYLIYLVSILLGTGTWWKQDWQLKIRTTRKPVPFMEADSPSFWTLLRVIPAMLKHWLTLSRS